MLWVVAVTLSTDSLHLFDLTCLTGSLNVFEVNFRVLAEVHNRAQKVEQTWETHNNLYLDGILNYLNAVLYSSDVK